MSYPRLFRLSVLFLSALIHLLAQLSHPQVKDPWDDVHYRQAGGAPGTLNNPSIRDFVMSQTMLIPPGQPANRPITGTVSVSRLKHRVPPKAQNEVARAEREFRKGRLQSSIEHLKKVIAIDPDYMEAHNNLGGRYIALGDNLRAVDQLQAALQLDPSSTFAQLNLGLALYSMKRCDQAEQYARNALRLEPALPKAHYLLGLILEAQGKNIPEAVEHLERSAEEFPKAHLLAARSLLKHGAVDAAALEFRRYLAWPKAEGREQIEQWLAVHEP